MKLVTLMRDLRPYRKGDNAVLPDDLAEKAVKNGDAENSRPYPPPDVAPRTPVGTLHLPKGRYMTRKRG